MKIPIEITFPQPFKVEVDLDAVEPFMAALEHRSYRTVRYVHPDGSRGESLTKCAFAWKQREREVALDDTRKAARVDASKAL